MTSEELECLQEAGIFNCLEDTDDCEECQFKKACPEYKKNHPEISRVYVTNTKEAFKCYTCGYTGLFEECDGSWPWCPYCKTV